MTELNERKERKERRKRKRAHCGGEKGEKIEEATWGKAKRRREGGKRDGDSEDGQREKRRKIKKGEESPSPLPYTRMHAHKRRGEMRKGWQPARVRGRKKNLKISSSPL